VQAKIGDYEFTGTMQSGLIQIANVHTEQIGDECSWRFTQKISGSGEKLRFIYEEQIVGTDDGCYRPCGATGEIIVVR
jgi:hypothetical protein